MKEICRECHQVHPLPTFYSTCQFCNEMTAAHDLRQTEGHVSICAACQALERK